MTFTLPDLPYEKSALEPHISAKTLDFHHGKHHATYVNKLNEFTKGTVYENQTLVDVIKNTFQKDDKIFNNAAQVWNHSFYWLCMTPNGGGKPAGIVGEKIKESFRSYEAFAEEFKTAAISQFGSGWAWLVADQGALKIVKTPNAVPPMVTKQDALLTCDVWEHAYYLDYQNKRPDYVSTFLEHLVNWNFVEQKLTQALG